MPRQQDMYSLYIEARDRLLHEGYTQTSMRRFVRSSDDSTAESCGFENSLALGAGGEVILAIYITAHRGHKTSLHRGRLWRILSADKIRPKLTTAMCFYKQR